MEISGFFHEKNLEHISVGDKGIIILPDYFTEIDGVVTRINKTPIAKDTGAILYEVVMEAEKQGGFTDNISGKVVINNSYGTFTSVEEAYFSTPAPEEVKLKVDGELSKLYVSAGEYVEKETLIAEIENSSIQNDIDNQKIALEKKKMSLQKR